MARNATFKSTAPKPANGAESVAVTAAPPQSVSLDRLHFDRMNPRLVSSGKATDSEILDQMVNRFEIETLLSSIAANGYIGTEPLVGVEQANRSIRVIEGNRRLAALLILAGDPRAEKHSKLAKAYQLAPGAAINPVPVVVYPEGTEPKQLRAYLGVRHIVGSRPWDSYAKAAWVANVLEAPDNELTLEQIEEMTGDTQGTIARLVKGYYLVRQLIEKKRFVPSESYRRGRGSAVEFPFSWVYNALDYKSVRDWVGMSESIQQNPISSKKHLDQAGELMLFMFGHESSKIQPVIEESRELGQLAFCLGDDKMVAHLRNGKKVSDVIWSSKSGLDRVLQSLAKADEAISDALGSVDELNLEQVDRVEPDASKVRKKCTSLHVQLLQRKQNDE